MLTMLRAQIRYKRSTLLQVVVAPFLVFLLLWALQMFDNLSLYEINLSPATYSLPPLQPCSVSLLLFSSPRLICARMPL